MMLARYDILYSGFAHSLCVFRPQDGVVEVTPTIIDVKFFGKNTYQGSKGIRQWLIN